MRALRRGRATAGRSTLFPTHAYASEAGMSLRDYEDFYYARLPRRPTATRSTAWERQSDEVKRLADWIEGKEEVRVDRARAPTSRSAWRAAPGSRATASTTCRTASSSPARSRTAVNGEIAFSFPASYGGRDGGGRAAALRGRQGRRRLGRRRARTSSLEMLDTDEGARRLGELGIGTNYGIATGTKEILLDEKIGGTVHMAIGHELSGDRRLEQLRRPLGHGLRPAPGRRARGRRRRAAARRPLPGLGDLLRLALAREQALVGAAEQALAVLGVGR